MIGGDDVGVGDGAADPGLCDGPLAGALGQGGKGARKEDGLLGGRKKGLSKRVKKIRDCHEVAEMPITY